MQRLTCTYKRQRFIEMLALCVDPFIHKNNIRILYMHWYNTLNENQADIDLNDEHTFKWGYNSNRSCSNLCFINGHCSPLTFITHVFYMPFFNDFWLNILVKLLIYYDIESFMFMFKIFNSDLLIVHK